MNSHTHSNVQSPYQQPHSLAFQQARSTRARRARQAQARRIEADRRARLTRDRQRRQLLQAEYERQQMEAAHRHIAEAS